jgi:replicative superfamily II helicase
MVLLPSIIHEDLSRQEIVHRFGPPNPKRRYGVVALAPGFNWTKDWQAYGATIAGKDTVATAIDTLKNGQFANTLVLVNRYDGIDLPDSTCRILIFDGKPYSESLIDLYQEACRPDSEATLMRTVRTIEQGMGRSVRGEKDYSVVVIIGADITRLVRDKGSRKHLSSQMSAQIGIGLEIAEMAQQEIKEGQQPMTAFVSLIRQCLGRDDGWKAFYVEQMGKVTSSGANPHLLQLYSAELEAEQAYTSGDYATAGKKLQELIDGGKINREDRGWYLQEMARYNYQSNRPEAQRLQIAAHKENRLLLKPAAGVTVARLKLVSQGRMERIAKWVQQFEDYAQLDISLSDILARLVFGTKADKFEQALDELSVCLGFIGERPDKEWKEGPDNLWALDAKHYILWECKSEVDVARAEMNKREAEQMNRSSAWFDKHYASLEVKRIIIHPSHVVPSAAGLTHEIEAMRVTELKQLVKSVRGFFKSLESVNFKDLSTAHLQKLIDTHGLSVDNLLSGYTKKIKNLK